MGRQLVRTNVVVLGLIMRYRILQSVLESIVRGSTPRVLTKYFSICQGVVDRVKLYAGVVIVQINRFEFQYL